MSTQTASIVKTQSAIVGEYVELEVTVTTGDSFKVTYLSQIQNMVGLRMRDWSTVTFTWVGNVATVATAGLVTDRIVVLAGGIV